MMRTRWPSAIPTATAGLKFICRETVAPLPRSRFDHPLSSRFEEMDCIAVFDDVLVPWDRVLVDGRPGSGEIINSLGADFGALLNMQTAARMLSQLEFFSGLAMKVADAIGITGFLHVQEKLGEMLSHMEVARAVFYGAEAMAQPLANGVWVPGGHGLRAFHLQTGKIYSRFVEILQTLAAGGFFYAPTEADLASAELRPYLDRYVRGRPGVSAEERTALFKLAWDVTGDAFAQRMAQYVRYYSGDPIRLTAGFYTQYDKAPLFAMVERALGRRDGEPIPLSPDDPGAPIPYQPGTRGMAGTYAETSLPTRAAGSSPGSATRRYPPVHGERSGARTRSRAAMAERARHEGHVHPENLQGELIVDAGERVAAPVDACVGVVGALDGEDGRHAGLDERHVIAGEGVQGALDDEPGVGGAGGGQTVHDRLGDGRALEENGPLVTVEAADHVHVDHGPDARALPARERAHVAPAAEQPLLLAPEEDEAEIVLARVRRQHPGHFQEPGRAGAVVVGAGRGGGGPAREVDRIEVRGDHDQAARGGAEPPLVRDHVSTGLAVHGDRLEPDVVSRGDELLLRPPGGGAVFGTRRQPGAERPEVGQRRLEVLGAPAHRRAPARWDRARSRSADRSTTSKTTWPSPSGMTP